MKIAVLKTITVQTLFAIGMFTMSARLLYMSLKYGVVVGGKWGETFNKRQSPAIYWFCVACYGLIFGCSIWLLEIVVRDDFMLAKWPTISN
jgi:hypothetical protein